jgi:hypothetical protein
MNIGITHSLFDMPIIVGADWIARHTKIADVFGAIGERVD